MPRGATTRHVFSFRRSYSSEDEPDPKDPEVSDQNPDQRPLEPVALQLRTRTGPRLWWSVGLSVLCSVAAMTAIGCFCALIYPILKGMRVFVRASARCNIYTSTVSRYLLTFQNTVVSLDYIYLITLDSLSASVKINYP